MSVNRTYTLQLGFVAVENESSFWGIRALRLSENRFLRDSISTGFRVTMRKRSSAVKCASTRATVKRGSACVDGKKKKKKLWAGISVIRSKYRGEAGGFPGELDGRAGGRRPPHTRMDQRRKSGQSRRSAAVGERARRYRYRVRARDRRRTAARHHPPPPTPPQVTTGSLFRARVAIHSDPPPLCFII